MEGICLDRTDKRILAVLEKNARISVAEIGRTIGLSRPAVQDRINKMEACGVIAGYHTDISYEHDRLIRAILFVKIAQRPCDQALKWIASLEGVQEVLSLSGEIDALVKCAVPSVQALTALNDKIGASKLIANSTSHIILQHLQDGTRQG